jgi:hypothetical protein
MIITRKEAIKIAKEILIQAEKERIITADIEASKGIQYK